MCDRAVIHGYFWQRFSRDATLDRYLRQQTYTSYNHDTNAMQHRYTLHDQCNRACVDTIASFINSSVAIQVHNHTFAILKVTVCNRLNGDGNTRQPCVTIGITRDFMASSMALRPVP